MNTMIKKTLGIILTIFITLYVIIPSAVVIYIYIVEKFFYYPPASYLLYTVDKVNNDCPCFIEVSPSVTHVFQIIGSLKKSKDTTFIYVGHTFVRNVNGEPVKKPGIYLGKWKWYYTFIYGVAGLLGWVSRGTVNNSYALVVNIPTDIKGKVYLLGCGDNYTSSLYTRISKGHLDVVGHTVYLSEIHSYNLTSLLVKYFGENPCPCKCGTVPAESVTSNTSRSSTSKETVHSPKSSHGVSSSSAS